MNPHLAAVLAGLAVIFPAQGFAQDYEGALRTALRSCYDAGATAEEKYACMGFSARACFDQTDASPDESVLICTTAETEVWGDILREEEAFVALAIRASETSEDPCEPSTSACLEQLDQMIAGAAADMARQCEFESLPENAAGRPELAAVLCQMRETARNAIRMNTLKERVQ